jgi:hypothetical protein
VPAVGSTVEDTPLVRLREAMSRYQVDAILVVGREDGRPLRWMTKRGLVGEAARDSSRQAIGHVVSQFRGETSLEQLRELVREPDVSRVLVWCNSAPFAIVGADELGAQTATALSGSPASAPPRTARLRSSGGGATVLAGHARRLLGLVARAQPDADGWASEAQLEAMVPGGRLEWRVRALEAMTLAGLLDRVQRNGQFDYRLTPKGLRLAEAHRAPSSRAAESHPVSLPG